MPSHDQRRILLLAMARSFVDIASSWVLTVSLAMTKGMKIGKVPSFEGSFPVCNESVKMVKEFSYLGCVTLKMMNVMLMLK